MIPHSIIAAAKVAKAVAKGEDTAARCWRLQKVNGEWERVQLDPELVRKEREAIGGRMNHRPEN